jgi:hypothetical protein
MLRCDRCVTAPRTPHDRPPFPHQTQVLPVGATCVRREVGSCGRKTCAQVQPAVRQLTIVQSVHQSRPFADVYTICRLVEPIRAPRLILELLVGVCTNTRTREYATAGTSARTSTTTGLALGFMGWECGGYGCRTCKPNPTCSAASLVGAKEEFRHALPSFHTYTCSTRVSTRMPLTHIYACSTRVS